MRGGTRGVGRGAGPARRGLHRCVASLTIATILGTLVGCGVYGRPKRPVAEPAALAPIGFVEAARPTAG